MSQHLIDFDPNVYRGAHITSGVVQGEQESVLCLHFAGFDVAAEVLASLARVVVRAQPTADTRDIGRLVGEAAKTGAGLVLPDGPPISLQDFLAAQADLPTPNIPPVRRDHHGPPLPPILDIAPETSSMVRSLDQDAVVEPEDNSPLLSVAEVPSMAEMLGLLQEKHGPGVDSPLPSGSGRMVPDVGGDAAPSTGWKIMANGAWMVVGGTSAVSPMIVKGPGPDGKPSSISLAPVPQSVEEMVAWGVEAGDTQ